ncbi:MAG: cyclic nucleotide-binding domain-containing protein, partial [Spirochaetales bacterium]|nr:cyclic nucleotide-binding domain-containing protein [Spirochaetales bacterium]
IIFQRGFYSKIMDSSSGSFLIPNDILSVPIYAGIAATSLSHSGMISFDKKMHLQLALAELIVNGIEHGNCGVTYTEKTESMENGCSVVDLVAKKCENEEVAAKHVMFEWDTHEAQTKFVITDDGDGFDVDDINQKLKTQDELSLHGRGIRMARFLSKEMYYNDKGNQVTFIIEHEKQPSGKFPQPLIKEEILEVKVGDIVFEEGDSSDYLYYIVSGYYHVLYQEKTVGELSPNDIFMGEMSFLLSNKRNGTVKAVESGKLIKISRKSFISLIRDYPYYGIFLSRLLAKRLARSNEQNVSLTAEIKKMKVI